MNLTYLFNRTKSTFSNHLLNAWLLGLSLFCLFEFFFCSNLDAFLVNYHKYFLFYCVEQFSLNSND